MALTGILEADFSKFYDAVTKANVKLTEFETGAGKVSKQLQKMSDEFSGQKVIADATLMAEAIERLGGTSKLTAAELAKVGAASKEAVEKLRALGMDVPENLKKIASETNKTTGAFGEMLPMIKGLAGAFGLTFSISTVVNFTKEIFSLADAMEKLAVKTGSSVGDVMKLRTIAGQTSVEMDTLAKSMNTLQGNLADPSNAKAIDDLKLSWVGLKAASPYDALKQVGEAIAAIPDTAERARVGQKLLGNSWSEIVASMSGDWDKLTEKTNTSVDQQIAALNRFKNEAGGTWVKFQNEAIDSMGNIAIAWEKLKDDPITFAKAMAVAWSTGANPYDAIQAIGQVEGAVRQAGETAKKSYLVPKVSSDLQSLAALQTVSGGVFQTLQTGGDAVIANNRAMQESWKKSVEAWQEINSVGVDYKATIDSMSDSTAGAIDYYLRAGVSQAALAVAYGATAAQVAAVAKALDVEKKAYEDQEKIIEKTRKIWLDLGTTKEDRSATTTGKMILDVERWYAAEKAKVDTSKGDWTAFLTALGAQYQEKMDGIAVNWDVMKKESKASLDDTAARAEATWQAMAATAGEYTPEIIQKYRDQAEAARQLATDWNTAGDAGAQAQQKVKDAADKTNQSVDQQKAKVDALAGSFSVLNMSADQWRAKAAQLSADAARMENTTDPRAAGAGSWYGQTIRNYRAGAASALASAGRQEQLDQQVAGMNAPWGGGGGWTVNVNAMQGIDGDQIAAELVNGMRRRGLSFG